MFTIHTYTDTKCELEMAKTRLSLLMDKKENSDAYCEFLSNKINQLIDYINNKEKDND